MSFKDQLNKFYKNLDDKANQIKDSLIKNGFSVKKGYFNGHYLDKDSSGNYVKDFYPIPVLEVEGLCDIEIGGDCLNISSKTSIKNAFHLDYEKFLGYSFDVYGVVDYLSDYYKSGEDIAKLYMNLKASKENEIGFAFNFFKNVTTDEILEVMVLLKNNSFYY